MSKLSEMIARLCPNGVEYKKLGEVARIRDGRDYKYLGKGEIPVYGSGGIMTYVDSFAYDGQSVLIPRKGSLDKIYYTEGKIWTVDTIFYTEIDHSELALVAETDKYTVVGSYEPEKQNSLLYESEAALERRFIALLCEQGYEYLDFHTDSELIANLRRRLEALNRITFTDGEWERFFKTKIADEREQALEKTRKIQEDYIQILERDDGTTKNIRLIDKQNRRC